MTGALQPPIQQAYSAALFCALATFACPLTGSTATVLAALAALDSLALLYRPKPRICRGGVRPERHIASCVASVRWGNTSFMSASYWVIQGPFPIRRSFVRQRIKRVPNAGTSMRDGSLNGPSIHAPKVRFIGGHQRPVFSDMNGAVRRLKVHLGSTVKRLCHFGGGGGPKRVDFNRRATS